MKGCTWFCFTTVFTLAAIYRIEMGGFDPLQLVLAGTVMELATFLFEVPTGVIADVRSRRLSMILGHSVMGLGFLVEGLWASLGPILLAQCIFGLGYTMISGAEDAWLADEIGEQRFPRAALRGTQAEQVGAFLGIIASVVLASHDLRWPFFAGAAGLWLLALFLWRSMPETRRPTSPSSPDLDKLDFVGERLSDGWQEFSSTLRQGFRFTRRHPLLLTLMGVALCYGMSSEGLDRLWEAHLLSHFTLPPLAGLPDLVWFGILSAGVMLCTLVATEWMQRRLWRRRDDLAAPSEADDPELDPALPVTLGRQLLLRLLAAQSVLLVIGLVIFALSDRFLWAALAFIMVNVLRRLARPLFLSCVNRGLDPAVRATVLSTVNQMDSIGQVSGGPVVGALGSRWGLRLALLAVAALLMPVWVLFRRALKQVRPSGRPAATDGA